MSFAQPQDSDLPARLPRRRAASGSDDGAGPAGPAAARRSGALLDVVEDALLAVTGSDANVYGMLVASSDGLVLASDTRDVHIDTVAAMAAAAASIASQFTDQADVGESRASIFEGSSGYVGVFPVEASVLLVVFGQKDMTMGLFNVAARNALSRFREAIDRQRLRIARESQRAAARDATEDAAGGGR
jgi:predicted regulator of Ras-like GTPase activity (Roadblock/LC7/MglB family)